MVRLEHGPIVPQVERLLRERIRKGDWRQGERLPSEAQLAVDTGVGRSSVREAVRLLVRDGVLDVRHGSGTFVADPQGRAVDATQLMRRARLREVYEARRALEVEAARLAALRATPADVARLRDLIAVRHGLKGASPEVFVDADLAFHRAVVELAGNAILLDLYATAVPVMREALVAMETHEAELPDTADAHDALVDAIERGDPEAAIAATVENMRSVID